MPRHKRRAPRGLSRRTFLKYSAGAGMLLGAGGLLPARTRGAGRPSAHARPMERRTYLLNFSHMDTSAHDLILVAGKRRLKLRPVTSTVLRRVRREHPILTAVPDEHLTHHVRDLAMPADATQLCYVQRVAREAKDGSWDMALLFYHHPATALVEAHRRGKARAGGAHPPVHVKWARYGLTPATRAALNDPLGEEMLQDATSQAVAMVAGHPELLSLEPNSAADIQTNIIGTQPSTQDLANAIAAQGPATPTGGWATQTPLINPDTGQPATNSHGQTQYMPVWSQATGHFAGLAMLPALDTAKDDTTLGANITALDPTTITTNDPNAPTYGKIWTLHDGMPTVDQSPSARLQANGLTFDVQNKSPNWGYSVTVTNVDANRTVTIQAKNWFVRFLGLYIRYLDGNGQPIPLSSLESEIKGQFPFWDLGLNGEFDAFLNLVNAELVVFGIPAGTTTIEETFPMPQAATSALILAGGLGRGDNPYPETVKPGKGMTIVFDYIVPGLFIVLAAAAAFAQFALQLQGAGFLAAILRILILLFFDLLATVTFDDPAAAFGPLAVQVGQILLSGAAAGLAQAIATAIAAGEAETAVTDAVPIVGTVLSAIFAAGLAAQIIETSVEVAQAPNTYVDQINFTHDVTVTIFHDPNDRTGFPATATSFTVTAIFDGGTPHVNTQAMPGGTVTTPLMVTFAAVPAGGQVTVNVGFYSSDGWLAGQGSVGPVANTATTDTLQLQITITENLVPLSAQTVYSHKEIIALDAAGTHQWEATTTPPTVVTPEGLCRNADGQLCTLTGITVSTVNAAVGYAWQAYSAAVGGCVSGVPGQLYQFANLSITGAPQSGYFFSGCGFSAPARIVYDLLGKQDWNFYLDSTSGTGILRQIRLSGGSPSFDGPTSNKAWGQLHFASDALLLHPLGKIISINTRHNKIEVLDLPAAAVPDNQAPQSQVYSGHGIREGRMDGPALAALTPQGTILILETRNNRIQAFDLSANPKRHFHKDAYFVPLIDPPNSGVTYLDLAVEYSGYLYVLSFTGQPGAFVYRLDLYTPDGDWLARTTGVNAAKLAVNYWRDVFTLNYQVLTLPNGSLPAVTEPSVSHWIPSTP